MIEDDLRDLNKLTARDLLEPVHSLKILPKPVRMAILPRRAVVENPPKIMPVGMVGATRIELVTPTMST